MWKVRGTKIEQTRARFILFGLCAEIREKCLTGRFFGAATHGILMHSENIVGLGDPASVPKMQWLKPVLLQKQEVSK